jgi:FkbM family methyltransferase
LPVHFYFRRDKVMEIFEYKGIKFIRKNDLIVDRLIKEKQDFEKKTTDWLMSHLQREKTFVDVGHSTGWFSMLAAKTGCKVIGFEPMDIAYNRALENMRLNELDYTIHNAAVSDSTGETKIYFNPTVPITTGASLDSSVRSKLNTKFATVKTVRLDDLLMDEEISLIKIDVEGHELNVLKGAENIIQKCKPNLVLEANDDHHLKILENWLKEYSYTYEIADERNMLCSYIGS